MGISIRAYARHRGVTDTAVHKAIRSGRITSQSDGTIDPARADQEWARNTDVPRQGTGHPNRPTTHTTAHKSARNTAPESAQASSTEPASPGLSAPGSGGTSLLQARTVNEVVKAQTNKVRLARLKGELVDRPQAIAHVFKLARAERDAWLNWPARISAQMAARLEVDAHTMHVVLETAVREHLQELGELRPRVD